jgi:hypothetical protein
MSNSVFVSVLRDELARLDAVAAGKSFRVRFDDLNLATGFSDVKYHDG